MCNDLSMSDIARHAKNNIVPFSVLVEVTYRCNENCVHCCVDEHFARGMTTEQYNQLFDQLVNAGTMFIILTGGEPFLRPDFMEIVTSARKRRLSVTIFTNGTLLTPLIIAELKRLHVQQVHISVYSADPEKHDAITRISGSHAKSIANIRELVAQDVTVRIKCPLMRTTFDSIGDLKSLAKQLGIPIQFGTVITARNNGDASTHTLRLSERQLRLALSDPDITSRAEKPVHLRDNLQCIPCDAIFNGGAIDPWGNVYPCNQWRVCGGNILETPFKEIWKSSPEFQKLRDITLINLLECRDCLLFSYCARCPGLAMLEDGSLHSCSSSGKMLAGVRRELESYPSTTHIFSIPIERSGT